MATKSTPTYEHLSESKYAVSERSRRKRFWYSAGPPMNQGDSVGVVGFVWTHWCVDRGLRMPPQAGRNFALELYGASQAEAGLDRNDQTLGSWVWAGERVLAGDTITGYPMIEQSFSCPDAETLTSALLERGPVVAGLAWRDSMSIPEEIDGRMVCRVDGETTGGHAILFNGIDLDLELGGVRGFARFKNSWGAEWGDDGQALVSVADLAKLLEARRTCCCRSRRAARSAPAAARTSPTRRRRPAATARSRSAATCGRSSTRSATAPYADAIARGIQHEETRPPLTIGIKAPWGAGKTSLMRMIRDRLEWPSGKPGADLRGLHLVGSGPAAVTNRTVLERARSHARPAAGELTATPDAADEDERRWRPTVWFNPWMYQTGEQVWAGLAHEIITQVTERMPRAERERFWLELNVRRVDEQAVRRRIYALVLERVLPWALGGLRGGDRRARPARGRRGPGGGADRARSRRRRGAGRDPAAPRARGAAERRARRARRARDRADDQLARLREPDRRLLPAPGRPPAGARPRRYAAAAADRVRRRPRPLLARHGRRR